MDTNLKTKMENWFNSLDYDLKVELMADEFPDEAHLIEVEEAWNGLNFEEKYEIYRNSDDEVELTDEEKREIVGDRKAHEIMEQEGHIT